jgi:hypothetical protein
MDWLNLHISVLDSPQVLRCDPVRRATWLFLLRYCISQENGGVIEDCAAWGDTSWQQIVRVKLREVRAESPLWTWEGDSLRVTFYPTEKETEVQAKRELARTNGRRGGRPRETNVGSETETDKEPTLVISAKAEGNGRERKGKEVSAAAPPHAQEPPPPPEPGLFDPDQGKPPGEPAATTRMVDHRDFANWRITIGHRVYVGRDERDEWLALYAAEGWDEMSKAYVQILDRTGRRFDQDDALHRCQALAKAINTDYADLPVRLMRCHAANDDPAFRHRHGALLPKRPGTTTRAERRTGISDAQRMADADDLAASLGW